MIFLIAVGLVIVPVISMSSVGVNAQSQSATTQNKTSPDSQEATKV